MIETGYMYCYTPPLWRTKEQTASTQNSMIKIGEATVQIKAVFDFFKSVEKHSKKLIIIPMIPIGLIVDTIVKISPILKQISPKVVV